MSDDSSRVIPGYLYEVGEATRCARSRTLQKQQHFVQQQQQQHNHNNNNNKRQKHKNLGKSENGKLSSRENVMKLSMWPLLHNQLFFLLSFSFTHHLCVISVSVFLSLSYTIMWCD